MALKVQDGPHIFELHNGWGTPSPDGELYPFGYISCSPTPMPVFALDTLLAWPPEELLTLAHRMAAASDLYVALTAVRAAWPVGQNNKEACEALVRADKALAKARGEN